MMAGVGGLRFGSWPESQNVRRQPGQNELEGLGDYLHHILKELTGPNPGELEAGQDVFCRDDRGRTVRVKVREVDSAAVEQEGLQPALNLLRSLGESVLGAGTLGGMTAIESLEQEVNALDRAVSAQNGDLMGGLSGLSANWYDDMNFEAKATPVHLLMLEDSAGLNGYKTLLALREINTAKHANPVKRLWRWVRSGVTFSEFKKFINFKEQTGLLSRAEERLAARLRLLVRAGLVEILEDNGSRIRLTQAGRVALSLSQSNEFLKLGAKDFIAFFKTEIQRLTLLKANLNQSLVKLERQAGRQEVDLKKWSAMAEALKTKVQGQLAGLARNPGSRSDLRVKRETETLTRLSVTIEVMAQRMAIQQRQLGARGTQMDKIKAVVGQQLAWIDQQVAKLFEALGEAEMTEQNKALATMMQSVGSASGAVGNGLEGVMEAIRRMYVHSDVTLDMASQSFDQGQAEARDEANYRALLEQVAAETAQGIEEGAEVKRQVGQT